MAFNNKRPSMRSIMADQATFHPEVRKILVRLIRRLWDKLPSKRITAAATSNVLKACVPLQQTHQSSTHPHPPQTHPNTNVPKPSTRTQVSNSSSGAVDRYE